MFTSSKPSILIVDDDLAILRAFTRIFESKGYLVTVAEIGKVAIEKLKINRYDVALVDFALPDMEGTQLFPMIKKVSPETVKIMLTGETNLHNKDGADIFIRKPVNPERLLSIIASELKNRNLEI